MKNCLLQLIALALPLAFIACSDDEEPTEYSVSSALVAPESVTLTSATTSSLSFEWTSVPGAVLYGYELVNANGKSIKGGTTTGTSASFTGLNIFSNYTVNVVAIPQIGKGQSQSAKTSISATTLFYDALDDASGWYTTSLFTSDAWEATLNEDRSADDYCEGTFGVFTLSNFFNRAAGKIVFTLNADNTIHILNANNPDRAEGELAEVVTGYSAPASRKLIFIDESSSVFDYTGRTLTFLARLSNGTTLTEELFEW